MEIIFLLIFKINLLEKKQPVDTKMPVDTGLRRNQYASSYKVFNWKELGNSVRMDGRGRAVYAYQYETNCVRQCDRDFS